MASISYKEIYKNGEVFIEEIHKVVVHAFSIGDVEDPEIYIAEPISKWMQTEAGQFIMNNCIETPEYISQFDFSLYGTKYVILAKMPAKKLTEYYLRFGKHASNEI